MAFEQAAARQGTYVRPSQLFEQGDAPLLVRAARGLGADQYELGRMRWMACGVGHGDFAAERGAQDDRTFDPQRRAEADDVITPLRQRPGVLCSPIAATVPAVIKADDWGDVGQRRVGGLIERVIEARPSMQQQERRLLAQDGALRHQGWRPRHQKNSRTPLTSTRMHKPKARTWGLVPSCQGCGKLAGRVGASPRGG